LPEYGCLIQDQSRKEVSVSSLIIRNDITDQICGLVPFELYQNGEILAQLSSFGFRPDNTSLIIAVRDRTPGNTWMCVGKEKNSNGKFPTFSLVEKLKPLSINYTLGPTDER
jgi:hypothetical protein